MAVLSTVDNDRVCLGVRNAAEAFQLFLVRGVDAHQRHVGAAHGGGLVTKIVDHPGADATHARHRVQVCVVAVCCAVSDDIVCFLRSNLMQILQLGRVRGVDAHETLDATRGGGLVTKALDGRAADATDAGHAVQRREVAIGVAAFDNLGCHNRCDAVKAFKFGRVRGVDAHEPRRRDVRARRVVRVQRAAELEHRRAEPHAPGEAFPLE